MRADAILLDLLQLAVDQGERLFKRLDELFDRLLPSGHLDARGLLELAERGPRESEERLVVLPQRVGGQRGEGVAHPRLGLRQQRQLLGRRAALRGDFCLQPRPFLLRAAKVGLERLDPRIPVVEPGLELLGPPHPLLGLLPRDGEIGLEARRAHRAFALGARFQNEPGPSREDDGEEDRQIAGHQDEV